MPDLRASGAWHTRCTEEVPTDIASTATGE
jgi:hypothetical protein